jgi:phosphatidate cytidylyltransferase
MPDASTNAAPAGSPPVSKGRIFFRRLFSFILLWGVVLGALLAGNKPVGEGLFLILMLAIAGLGLQEFYDLVEKRGLPCFRRWGVFCGLLMMASTFVYLQGWVIHYTHPAKANDFETGLLIMFVLSLCLRQFFSKTTVGLVTIPTTLLGLMYVPWLLNFIQKLHFFPEAHGVAVDGNFYIFYFILVTKFSDLGAYITGSLIGRHKMIPRVSPGKTWEGFVGALAVSTGASLVFFHLAGGTGGRLYGMTPLHATVLGLILGLAAVVGDLIESIFKREAGVKDSGRLFPGIGGMLDLMDSLLFNAPLMYLYLRHVLTR